VMIDTRPERLDATNVRAILVAFLDTHDRATSFPFFVRTPKDVEVGVAVPLFKTANTCLCTHAKSRHYKRACQDCGCPTYQDEIHHVSRIDLIGGLKSNPKVDTVTDHKTAARIDARFVKRFTMDSQISGYLNAAGYRLGVEPHRLVAFINAIELSLLPTSYRKCKDHGVPYAECSPLHAKFQIVGPIERTPGQIREWKRTAITLALQYRQLLAFNEHALHHVDTRGRFSGACSECELLEFCASDRPAHQIHHMLHKEPWDLAAHTGVKVVKPTVFLVDNSILRAVAICGTQALMRYGLAFTNREQSMPLKAGLSIHRALEFWFKGHTVERAMMEFDKMYENEEEGEAA